MARGSYSRRGIEPLKRGSGETPAQPYSVIVRKLDAFLESRGQRANPGTWQSSTTPMPAMRHAEPLPDGGRPTSKVWQTKWVKRKGQEPGRITPPLTRMQELRAIADAATRSGLIWRSGDPMACDFGKVDSRTSTSSQDEGGEGGL